MSFEETIKEWVSLDNEIKLYNEKIKSIRDKKNNITTRILKHVELNNLTNNQIKIANGKIKFIHFYQNLMILKKGKTDSLQYSKLKPKYSFGNSLKKIISKFYL